MPPDNAALDELLQRAALTPEQLAAAVNARLRSAGLAAHEVHPKTPWKWLRGQTPHPPLPGYVADVLSERVGMTVTAADLGFDTGRRAVVAVPADAGIPADYDRESAEVVIAELARRGQSDPRRYTPLRGPSLGQHAHRWLVAEPHSGDSGDASGHSAVGAEGSTAQLRAFRGVIDQLRRLDDEEGGTVVFPWAAREALWAIQLLREARGANRRAMFGVVAELAEVAGWAATDAGLHGESHRFHIAALHAAQAIGDREFGAYILTMLAFEASIAGQHRDALVLLETAQHGIRNVASLTMQAMIAAWHARALAGAGDRAGFERALSRAATLHERAHAGDAPEFAYWMPHPVDLSETARSWALVGEPRRAIDHLEAKVGAYADEYPRDEALTGAYLAEAYTLAGETDAAAHHTTAARGLLCGSVKSPRAEAVLTGLAGVQHRR